MGELIANATQGQAEAVFFQVDDWDSYWVSRGESPAQKLTEITGDPTLHQRVRNEGVDLSLPIKDYMTKLSGTEDINQLNKLARVSPDGMNLAEAREHFKDLNATVKDIASEADSQIAEVNKAKEMQDRFYNEYKATGVSPQQAKSYAVMNTSFYETMASRLNMPVDELYKLYPLRISPESAQVESVGEFSQDEQLDFSKNNELTQSEFSMPESISVVSKTGEARGSFKNIHTNKDLRISNDTIKKADSLSRKMSKAAKESHLKALNYLSELAKNAVLLTTKEDSKNRNFKWSYYFAPLNMDGVDYFAKISVKETNKGNVIHSYRLVPASKVRPESLATDTSVATFEAGKIPVNEFLQNVKAAREGVEYFQSAQSPAFYSKLRKTISDKLQGKSATADQVKALLKDIKAEEVEWSGINEFLKGKKKVDTQELLNYLDANQVNIQPVVLGEAAEDEVRGEYYIDEGPEGSPFPFAVKDWAGNNIESFKTEEDAESFIESIVEMSLPTKYEQYTLPGGENYREVLFTLPVEPIKNDMPNFDNWAKEKGLDPTTAARDWELEGPFKQQYLMELGKSVESKEVFRSSHFDQKNILAHVRLNDRTDKDGNRVLFVEEIQSDWHQAGRKKGYKGDDVKNANKEWKDYEKELKDKYGPTFYAKINTEEKAKYDSLTEAVSNIQSPNMVPNAPFKKTWHEFAFKNIIRIAAEGNYDKIAWTTGEQQAERFDLSKQVSEVRLVTGPEGRRDLIVIGRNEETIVRERGISNDKIEDYVGKEVASKLQELEPDEDGDKILKGLDLKVGGEGMKGFYDNILVKYANKLGKKFDAKVEDVEVVTGKEETFKSKQASKLKSSTKELTFEDFKKDKKKSDKDRTVLIATDLAGEEHTLYIQHYKQDKVKYSSPEADVVIDYNNLDDFKEALKGETEENIQSENVHSISVTDKMKEVALGEGFELFQEGKRGKISFFKSEEARRGAVIELMKAKDFSTALHESGHFFLEVMADLNDQENTPQDVKDDFKIIMDWMGVTDRSQIGVEQHEMWAETVEAYFMTGEAPSQKLKKIFNQFKAWLVSIYRNLGPQRAKLNPEIKAVMDRLLATEIEIEQAKDQMNFKPMFGKDLEKFGLTGEKAKRYKDAVIAAEDAASEILTAKLLKAQKIKEQKEWKEKEQAEREAVTEQVNSLKVYKAIDAIKEKREDGTNLKLSKESEYK